MRHAIQQFWSVYIAKQAVLLLHTHMERRKGMRDFHIWKYCTKSTADRTCLGGLKPALRFCQNCPREGRHRGGHNVHVACRRDAVAGRCRGLAARDVGRAALPGRAAGVRCRGYRHCGDVLGACMYVRDAGGGACCCPGHRCRGLALMVKGGGPWPSGHVCGRAVAKARYKGRWW